MFGLKNDWRIEVPHRYFTLEDYEGSEPRWCAGCGDFAALTAVQKICRDEQLLPEKTVMVSGIGCSSRFPHYMATYGFHGLHGRALPVACGIRSRRPDLTIFVATGDGDCISIGGGHLVHAIRYNMDMTVLLLDNNIYGLTKKQTSPTTKPGQTSNTHPYGAILPAMNPLTMVLGISNVSFVAQTVDWNPVHLHATLYAAYKHKGFSLVRILQRCPTYTAHVFEECQRDPSQLLLLQHEKGVTLDPAVARIFPNKATHDPSDINTARAAAENEELYPIGILYQNPERVNYETYTYKGLGTLAADKVKAMNRAFDHFAV